MYRFCILTWVSSLDLPVISYVTLGKLLCISVLLENDNYIPAL